VVATEADPRAAACARDNGVDVLLGDLDGPLPAELAGRVDVLTGVLPYVPTGALHLLTRDVLAYEPRAALDGGPGGLDVVARVVEAGPRWLAPGGWLLLEAGGGQFPGVVRLFADHGFVGTRILDDGDGEPRAVCGRLAGPTRTAGPGRRRGQASSR
jgi:release factor glutamine methyltransferase